MATAFPIPLDAPVTRAFFLFVPDIASISPFHGIMLALSIDAPILVRHSGGIFHLHRRGE